MIPCHVTVAHGERATFPRNVCALRLRRVWRVIGERTHGGVRHSSGDPDHGSQVAGRRGDVVGDEDLVNGVAPIVLRPSVSWAELISISAELRTR